jgi:fluoroquinolone transport system ATP-binding protein
MKNQVEARPSSRRSPTATPLDRAPRAMIRVENLRHSYRRDGAYQVDDVSFEVGEGEIFGFLGPNGAGKSTTQKILLGLIGIQEGQASIAGIDIRRPSRDLFEQIGVSFEQPNVYKKLTGLENLQFFRSLYRGPTEDPVALLKSLGLGEAMDKRVGMYSKGMQQRVVLARSLLNRPKMWFLDEPTSGLDPRATQEMTDLILAKREQGMTVFITTHNMQTADSVCDRVAFISHGRLVAMDTPRNLKLQLGEQLVKVEHRDGAGRLSDERLNLNEPVGRARFLELLDTASVETVHSQEATLEEVYIQLTGERLT